MDNERGNLRVVSDGDDDDGSDGDLPPPSKSLEKEKYEAIVRHPSENFIKYLMTTDEDEARKDEWISFTVCSLGFPKPHPRYLANLRSYLIPKIPENFQPKNRYHRESSKFLRSEGIWGLHNPDDAAREALGLLTNLKARSIVEQLLLGRIPSKEICKKVNSRLNEFLTVDGIEAYRNYYWNCGVLRVEEWAVLLSGEEKRSKILSILQVGPAMALHLAGFEQQIEAKVAFQDMFQSTYFDFLDWKTQPRSMDRTKAMTECVKAARNIHEAMTSQDAAIRESLKAFEQFRMQHASAQVRDIKEIAPLGNFTHSGVRLLEVAPEEEEKGEVDAGTQDTDQ